MLTVSARHRHTILRLLVALMVLAALAPGISRATTAWAQSQQPWQVVCHAGGPESGAVDAHGPVGMAGMDGGCAFCLLRADLAPPPAHAVQPLLHDGLRHGLPRLFLQAPAPLFAWRPAQARAPPLAA